MPFSHVILMAEKNRDGTIESQNAGGAEAGNTDDEGKRVLEIIQPPPRLRFINCKLGSSSSQG